ncbi:MAG: hypothetical protein H6860_02425 [Rhodospirillales bacterium]|nr:hypothetical protein [Rhodospirillales bacterium]
MKKAKLRAKKVVLVLLAGLVLGLPLGLVLNWYFPYAAVSETDHKNCGKPSKDLVRASQLCAGHENQMVCPKTKFSWKEGRWRSCIFFDDEAIKKCGVPTKRIYREYEVEISKSRGVGGCSIHCRLPENEIDSGEWLVRCFHAD